MWNNLITTLRNTDIDHQSTRHHFPQDHNVNTVGSENLGSQKQHVHVFYPFEQTTKQTSVLFGLHDLEASAGVTVTGFFRPWRNVKPYTVDVIKGVSMWYSELWTTKGLGFDSRQVKRVFSSSQRRDRLWARPALLQGNAGCTFT
jgi:hypothetical protein